MATFSRSNTVADSDVESTSSASGEDSFDERYHQLKPPPLEYQDLIHKIVHINGNNSAKVHVLKSPNHQQRLPSNIFTIPCNPIDLVNTEVNTNTKGKASRNFNRSRVFTPSKNAPLTGRENDPNSSQNSSKASTINNGAIKKHFNNQQRSKKNKKNRSRSRSNSRANNHGKQSHNADRTNTVEKHKTKQQSLKHEDLTNKIVHIKINDNSNIFGNMTGQIVKNERLLPNENLRQIGITPQSYIDPKKRLNNHHNPTIHQDTKAVVNNFQESPKFITCYNCTATVLQHLFSDHMEVCTRRNEVHLSLPDDLVSRTHIPYQEDVNDLEHDDNKAWYWCFCPKFCF